LAGPRRPIAAPDRLARAGIQPMITVP